MEFLDLYIKKCECAGYNSVSLRVSGIIEESIFSDFSYLNYGYSETFNYTALKIDIESIDIEDLVKDIEQLTRNPDITKITLLYPTKYDFN